MIGPMRDSAVLVLLCWLVAGLWGCQQSAAELTSSRIRDSAGITIVENPAIADQRWRLDSVPVLEIGGSTGSTVDLFRVVGGVRLQDGRIVVADGAPRLLAFSEEGALLRTVGQRGSGPGEFQSIDWMQVMAGDSIMVYDARLRRASVFMDSLRLARAVTPDRPQVEGVSPPVLRGVFRDGTLLGGSRLMLEGADRDGIVRPDLVLYHLDAGGALQDSLATVPGDALLILDAVIMRPRFTTKTRTAVGADEFFVATGGRFEVSVHGLDEGVRSILRKPHQTLPVPDAELAPLRAVSEQAVAGPVAFPAVGAMLLDDAGNLLVEEFQSDTARASQWWVFDHAGRLVSDVALTPRFRPLHIGRELVLGVWRDELDVERVRLYRLLKSS